MKKLFIAAVLAGAALVAGAETRTATFTVNPPMQCDNCVNNIKQNMRFEKGVVDVAPSLEAQNVVIKYNPAKTNTDRLISGFKKIGYVADTLGAPAKAAPSACSDGCCSKKK
jgi:copper chaperone CopZ